MPDFSVLPALAFCGSVDLTNLAAAFLRVISRSSIPHFLVFVPVVPMDEIFICILQFFVPDEQFSSVDYEIACLCQSVCLSVCLSRTFSYLLIQTSEVHETLPVLLLCQWKLVYQFSKKFINFYYPLPIIFVVIFSWDLGGLHRQRVVKVYEFFFNLVYKQRVVNKQPLQNSN